MDFEGMVWALQDGASEGDEGFGFQVRLLDGGGEVMVDGQRDVFDILFEEANVMSSVHNKSLGKMISLTPTLIDSYLNVERESENLKIISLAIYNNSGVLVRQLHNLENKKIININTENLSRSSFYYLKLNTSEGVITKKLVKH